MNIVKCFLNDSIIVKPVFPGPEENNKLSIRAYKRLVTKEELRLFVIVCGKNQYYFHIPEELLN